MVFPWVFWNNGRVLKYVTFNDTTYNNNIANTTYNNNIANNTDITYNTIYTYHKYYNYVPLH